MRYLTIAIKPGDLIEWAYVHNGNLVIIDEDLWSTIDNEWVPIGRNLVHMCIDIDSKKYSWLNKKGLFRAYIDDHAGEISPHQVLAVFPRVCTFKRSGPAKRESCGIEKQYAALQLTQGCHPAAKRESCGTEKQ